MKEYVVTVDELMDFACHFLFEGEKGREYSNEELVEIIEGARFPRLTRCMDCKFSRDLPLLCECELHGHEGTQPRDHYCPQGRPRSMYE